MKTLQSEIKCVCIAVYARAFYTSSHAHVFAKFHQCRAAIYYLTITLVLCHSVCSAEGGTVGQEGSSPRLQDTISETHVGEDNREPWKRKWQ